MPAAFHLKSLSVSRYRLFKHIKIDGLKRINIIGGSNGIGKSSLLDAAFHLADRLNAVTIFRPFEWRSVPIGPQDNLLAFKQIFTDQDQSEIISISASSTLGKVDINYKYGMVPIRVPVVSNISQPGGEGSSTGDGLSSTSSGEGYVVFGSLGGREDFRCNIQFTSSGFSAQVINQQVLSLNKCIMLNSTTRRISADASTRFSDAVKNGHVAVLLRFIHLVHPKISQLQILTSGGAPIIFADLGGEHWVPVAFLGEGAASLLSLALGMIDVQNGMIFLDEFDSVVHHGLLIEMWTLIFEISKLMNVQVFATTHSEESLEAAIVASERGSHLDDVNYVRLRRSKKGDVSAISYNGEKLKSALSESWEVR